MIYDVIYELAELVPPLCSHWKPNCYSHRLYDFPVTIPKCYKDVYVNSFFPRTGSPRNSLSAEYFLLTCDINVWLMDTFFPWALSRHLYRFSPFVFLFLVPQCLVVAVQPYMEWNPIKKIVVFKIMCLTLALIFNFWKAHRKFPCGKVTERVFTRLFSHRYEFTSVF